MTKVNTKKTENGSAQKTKHNLGNGTHLGTTPRGKKPPQKKHISKQGRPMQNERSNRSSNFDKTKKKRNSVVESNPKKSFKKNQKQYIKSNVIVVETVEDMQAENDRLTKEIQLEIANIKTITID